MIWLIRYAHGIHFRTIFCCQSSLHKLTYISSVSQVLFLNFLTDYILARFFDVSLYGSAGNAFIYVVGSCFLFSYQFSNQFGNELIRHVFHTCEYLPLLGHFPLSQQNLCLAYSLDPDLASRADGLHSLSLLLFMWLLSPGVLVVQCIRCASIPFVSRHLLVDSSILLPVVGLLNKTSSKIILGNFFW